MEEEAPKDLGDRKDHMTIRHSLKHMLTEPLTEFNHTFLMAGRAEVPALT